MLILHIYASDLTPGQWAERIVQETSSDPNLKDALANKIEEIPEEQRERVIKQAIEIRNKRSEVELISLIGALKDAPQDVIDKSMELLTRTPEEDQDLPRVIDILKTIPPQKKYLVLRVIAEFILRNPAGASLNIIYFYANRNEAELERILKEFIESKESWRIEKIAEQFLKEIGRPNAIEELKKGRKTAMEELGFVKRSIKAVPEQKRELVLKAAAKAMKRNPNASPATLIESFATADEDDLRTMIGGGSAAAASSSD